MKDLFWLFFGTPLLTSGFNFDESTQFAGRFHLLIKLGLSIDEYDVGLGVESGLAPLGEVEGALEHFVQQLKGFDCKKQVWNIQRPSHYDAIQVAPCCTPLAALLAPSCIGLWHVSPHTCV